MTSTSSDSQQLGPVQAQERIVLLDVLRAVAVLGMFYVHAARGHAAYGHFIFDGGLQSAANFGIDWLASSKFRALFGLLMGVGMAVQVGRAEARGTDIVPVYLRRLLILWVLGTTLGLVIPADYLATLAVAGLVTFFVAYGLRRHTKILVVVALWLFLSDGIQSSIDTYERPIRDAPTAEEVERVLERLHTGFEANQEEALAIQSPFYSLEYMWDEFTWRFDGGAPWEFHSLEHLVRQGEDVLPYILLGFWLWQLGLLQRSWEHKRLFEILLLICGGVGLATGWFESTLSNRGLLAVYGLSARLTASEATLRTVLYHVSRPALVMAYISLTALLLARKGKGRVLRAIAPVGRMAFTSYILQFVLPPVLFPMLFAWWLPASTPITNLVKTTVVFALMVLFSTWWLKRFRFGPFEWLWRSLTYWKIQPMRVEQPVGAAGG